MLSVILYCTYTNFTVLKGTVSLDFRPSVFFFKQSPWVPDHGLNLVEFFFVLAKKFDFLVADFRACGANDNRMQEIFLDSPLNYI
jgi:hypothetical protein